MIRREPYLVWFGGFICIVLAVGALAVIASSRGWLEFTGPLPAVAAEQFAGAITLADRADCAQIGRSDLRSAPEGLWFQSNCLPLSAPPLIANMTSCNRASLNPAEFTAVSPGLYVFRQARPSPAYLWYASSETCFDLVSARVVTAVCADQTLTFDWDARPCSAHGGVLAWVNGR